MEFINDSDHFDQHFLIDDKIKNNFINYANITENDVIVEVGPGKGIITKELAQKAKKVICIELDTRLKPFLDEICKEYSNVETIYRSALDVFIPPCDKIITSLPYSIVEPFIDKLIRCDFKEAVLITGNRFASSTINKELNALSLLTNSFFKVQKLEEILPTSFSPEPHTLSAIIKLIPKKKEELENNFKEYIYRELFFNRNKKLKNNLVEAYIQYNKINNKTITKKESKSIILSHDEINSILNKNMSNISNEDILLIDDLLNKLL